MAPSRSGYKLIPSSVFPTIPFLSSSSSQSNPHSRSHKRHSHLPRWLLLLATLIPIIVISVIFYQLAIITNAFRTYEAQPHIFAEPFRGKGEDIEGRAPEFPNWVTTDRQSVEATVWGVKKEMSNRFAQLGLKESTVGCPAVKSNLGMMPTVLERRYEHLLPSIERNPYLPADRPQGFFIAINLFNSKAVIPHLFQTLLSISALLGPSNVHIAIFENGSWDETVPAMAHFARALTALGVAHSIRSDAHQTDWEHVDRIAQLAEYRNVALQPLTDFDLSSPNGKPIFNPPFVNSSLPHPTVPTDVLFINDIFVCPTDILELLHQRRFQDASATCGLDWREAPEGSMWRWLKGWLSKNYRFYDNWVTRSMEGFPLRPRVDMFGELRDGVRELFHWDRDPTYLIRWRAALPLPVYSCWNGMIVLDASPFLPSSSLPLSQAHPSHEPFKFRNGDEAVGECAASECKLIARDFWGVGKKRWVLVPRVAVTYDEEGYKAKWIEERVRRGGVLGMMEDLEVKKFRHAPSEAMELEEKIDWSLVKDPEQVVCFPFHQGSRLEIWPFYKDSASTQTPSTHNFTRTAPHIPFEDIF